MSRLSRTDVEDLRGLARTAFEAVGGVAGVVERIHTTIQRLSPPVGTAVNVPAVGITGLVYRSVRGCTRLVGAGVDGLLGSLARVLPEGTRTDGREALVAVVNGIYGDYLAETSNSLAIEMSLRHAGRPFDVRNPGESLRAAGAGAPSPKIAVLVHGLCMNDSRWLRDGHDHGAALAEELGYSVLYLRYNSGLRISENGRLFSALLEELVEHWPVPVEGLALIGHSMGGLVARSACHHAGQDGGRWRALLRTLVFLGTPHLGAPLERAGRWVDFLLEISPYSAPLAQGGKRRSAGIRDLRNGRFTRGRTAVPLPRGVRCYAVAATLGSGQNSLADRLIGDGLVPLDSALGRARDRSRALRIPRSHRWIGRQMGHLDLLCRPEVYAQLRSWLA